MENEKTARRGGLVKYAIYLGLYVLLILIMPKILNNATYQLTMYILMGIAGLVLSMEDLKEAGRSWKAHPFKNLLIIAGAYILIQILDNLLVMPYALIFAEQAVSLNENNIAAAAQVVNPVLFIIAAGILGPVTEETVFRNILVSKAGSIFPKVLMVILSSIAFGLIHMHAFTLSELLYVLPHIGTGVLLSVLLLKQKNVTQVFAIHILLNLPSAIVMFLR
jgi:membrane protease YdiL (CAAX protease family)